MDAQSFHKKNTPSTTTSRLHARWASAPDELSEEDVIVASDPDLELDERNPNSVVTLMDELGNAEDAKATADEATANFDSSPNVDENPWTAKKKDDDPLPQAAILTMTEEKRPSFNAFSSIHASAPVPRQNRQSPVAEAKPVKDNANAIIMILLIAILVIAVAIFGVIVLYEHRHDHDEPTPAVIDENAGKDDKDDAENEPNSSYSFDDIIGNWIPASNAKACLRIEADKKVSWYTSCDSNQSKDYYVGKSEIIRGQDAIDLLGITKERAARKVGLSNDELQLDNIYVLSTTPEQYVLDGKEIAKPEKINLLFVYTKDGDAQAYDYNFGELYVLSKSDSSTE